MINDKPINLLEVQPEVAEEEPIEEVFPQEPEDVRILVPCSPVYIIILYHVIKICHSRSSKYLK
jgi:hypothetical protein